MNPRLFGAIVVVGSLAGCRTGILPASVGAPTDLAAPVDQAQPRDQGQPRDQARPPDLAGLHPCCARSGGPDPCCDPAGQDLSGCIPVACILIL